MPKLTNGWTKWVVFLMLMLPATGCTTAVSGDALCNGTATARTEHAAALVDDGGNLSVVTGAHLIRLIDAGCADQ